VSRIARILAETLIGGVLISSSSSSKYTPTLCTAANASLMMQFTHLFAAAALSLVPGAEASAFRTKRDAVWLPSDPHAFEVNLGFDSVGRYLTPIGMVRRAFNLDSTGSQNR
jgi:hypothetical protein